MKKKKLYSYFPKMGGTDLLVQCKYCLKTSQLTRGFSYFNGTWAAWGPAVFVHCSAFFTIKFFLFFSPYVQYSLYSLYSFAPLPILRSVGFSLTILVPSSTSDGAIPWSASEVIITGWFSQVLDRGELYTNQNYQLPNSKGKILRTITLRIGRSKASGMEN